MHNSVEDDTGSIWQRLANRPLLLLSGVAIIAVVGIGIGYWIHPNVGSSASVPAQAQTNGRQILYYRSPMNPSQTSPTPMKDAMGMDYTPVYADEVAKAPGTFQLSTEKMQRAGVRVDAVRTMALVNSVRATGTVAADESRQAILNARFDGFVEKLYISTTGAHVRAGQPLASVWIQSNEVLVKEADFIGSLAAHADDQAKLAESILLQYGVPKSVLNDMRRTGRTTRSILITAPLTGTVLEKPAVTGMHFAAGDTLFKTADLSSVWVMAQVSERDLIGLKSGQAAAISFRDNPGASFKGKVAFIYPEVNPDTRTTQVRIVVDNAAGQFRIGQYADVRIDAPVTEGEAVVVPESAIIDDGSKQTAFVSLPNGVFEARQLTLGARANGYAEVRSGLEPGEKIVVSGNFLIDSESNLQTAVQSLKGSSSDHAHH
jgi:membrane fusion protein, copper/silver efflux system